MEGAIRTAAISRAIGYAPALAHSLIGSIFLCAQLGDHKGARAALEEAADCFRFMEDETSLQVIVA